MHIIVVPNLDVFPVVVFVVVEWGKMKYVNEKKGKKQREKQKKER